MLVLVDKCGYALFFFKSVLLLHSLLEFLYVAYSEVQIYPYSLKDGKFLQGWDYNLLLSFSTKSILLLSDFNSFVKC